MGRYWVSGKARKKIISLFRDVMFVCLTGVVWFRADLGGKKARIFIHKKNVPLYLSLFVLPPLEFEPILRCVLGSQQTFFLRSHVPFEKAIMFETAETNPFSSFETAVFWGISQSFYPPLASCWESLRLSNGTPWERQLWILLRGGGREMDFFHLITGVMKGKPPQVRGRYRTLPEINGSHMKRWHPKKEKIVFHPLILRGKNVRFKEGI